MTGYLCLLTTPDGLCCNCGDEGIILRGETPIRNAKNLTFCSVECADEFDTRAERSASDWCTSCGYDRHEHAPDCSLRSIGGTP